ncbi:MAG: hypothetical protein KDC12_06785 [Flavobacteriales bacterium]|nr:hypothetical protein [Flavobacteriales bacterium]
MNTLKYSTLLFSCLILLFTACKKDEEKEDGEELDLKFKTEEGYIHSNTTLPTDSTFTIGIEADTESANDPIISFNISESLNGGSSSSIYTESLEDVEFEYDFVHTLEDSVSGNEHTFTFTITNRDGLTEHKSLTISVE